tara:strand:+ start:1576 stop:2514 length:939 start_codon:yes stop_codon:yes gene_type:complete
MPKKTSSSLDLLSLNFSISEQARKIIENKPYKYPERLTENIQKIRTKLRASAEPLVQKVVECHAVEISEKNIGDVHCLIVSPKKRTSDKKILYAYGGGFVTGSAFEDLPISVPLSALSGLEIIIPEYRLAPEYPWPAACDDVIKVYCELAEEISVITGESAGGNLALVTLLRAKKLGLTLPKAVVLLSPWCNLLNEGDSLLFNEGRDPTLSIQQSKRASAHYAPGQDLCNPEISPLFGSFYGIPAKVLISSGTRDLLLSQSVQLTSSLRDFDVDVDLRIRDGLWHVYEWDAELPEAIASIRQTAEFIQNSIS